MKRVCLLGALALTITVQSMAATSTGWQWNYVPYTGLVLSNPSTAWTNTFNLLWQMGALTSTGSADLHNGFDVSTSKVYWTSAYKNFSYGLSGNFSNNDYQKLENFYLGYKWNNGSVQLGQTSPLFGLANSENGNAVNLLTLPLPVQAFSPAYLKGIYGNFNTNTWVFQGSINTSSIGHPPKGYEPVNETLRTAFSPFHTDHHAIHYALSLWNQDTDANHTASFSSDPEVVTPDHDSLLDTGTIEDVSHYDIADAEFAYVLNQFSTQAEYIQTWVFRQKGLSTLNFNGYYGQIGYFLTPGMSRLYSWPEAYFTNVTPVTSPFGAWEVEARYSDVDLSDDDVKGGKEHDITLGLNWFLNQNLELEGNYIYADANPSTNDRHQIGNIFALQLQLYF